MYEFDQIGCVGDVIQLSKQECADTTVDVVIEGKRTVTLIRVKYNNGQPIALKGEE